MEDEKSLINSYGLVFVQVFYYTFSNSVCCILKDTVFLWLLFFLKSYRFFLLNVDHCANSKWYIKGENYASLPLVPFLTFRWSATLPWCCRNSHYAPHSFHKNLNDSLPAIISGATQVQSFRQLA